MPEYAYRSISEIGESVASAVRKLTFSTSTSPTIDREVLEDKTMRETYTWHMGGATLRLELSLSGKVWRKSGDF